MTTAENQFTKQERVCVNCRHHRRSWSFQGITGLLFESGDGDHHLCALRGTREELNPITGRVRVSEDLRSCRRMLNDDCQRGDGWEPSERFARRKENLFKVIAMDRKESK